MNELLNEQYQLLRKRNLEVLHNPLVYIWGKLFLVLCLCITMFFVNKIVKKITGDVNSAKQADSSIIS